MILFISGGARSGKSSYAEQRAKHWQQTYAQQLVYIATATVNDPEMGERIQRHQQQRVGDWITFETSDSIIPILQACTAGAVVLIDCLTTWLDQALFHRCTSRQERIAELKQWSRISREKHIHLILVSNDVNEGMPSAYPSVHEYIRELEVLHRLWIKEADEAIQVVAGLPICWKEAIEERGK